MKIGKTDRKESEFKLKQKFNFIKQKEVRKSKTKVNFLG